MARRHRHRQRRGHGLLAAMLAGGALVVVIVLRGAPLGEPAPAPAAPPPIEPAGPSQARAIPGQPGRPCPRGAETYIVSEVEWLCVTVTPPAAARPTNPSTPTSRRTQQ